MYTMPEKQTGSQTVSDCPQSCFYQYANYLPFRLLFIKLKYIGFFYDLLICFISLYIYKGWTISYEFMLSKEKNWRKCVFTTTAILICFGSTFLPPYANSPSSGGFQRRQNCCLRFLRCLPFLAPFLFWRSRFYKLSFKLFISTF